MGYTNQYHENENMRDKLFEKFQSFDTWNDFPLLSASQIDDLSVFNLF